MITAKHKKLWELFFVAYSRFYLKKLFYDVRYVSDIAQPPLNAVLLIANHFSFWDGFIQMHLSRKLFKKKVFIMMLKEQLLPRKFLRYGGCFSIDKGSRSVVESINYSRQLLYNPENMLLIFPQGKLESLYTSRFTFESGLKRIMTVSAEIDIYLNINLINYYSNKKPTLTAYLKKVTDPSPETIEEQFNQFAQECRQLEESPKPKGEKL